MFVLLKIKQEEFMKEIEIYKSKEGKTQILVKFENDSVWLNQYQLAELFNTDRTSILKHLQNIYSTHELNENLTCAKIAQVRKEGNREVKRDLLYYNLDAIISVGYRVNSKQGTQFRQWATQRLRDYLVNGYAINEKRLKETEERFLELKKTVSLLGNVVKTKALSGDEAQGLLRVLSDYTFA